MQWPACGLSQTAQASANGYRWCKGQLICSRACGGRPEAPQVQVGLLLLQSPAQAGAGQVMRGAWQEWTGQWTWWHDQLPLVVRVHRVVSCG